MAKYVVGKVADFPEGKCTIVEAAGRSVGVFHVNGAFYTLLNRCPHQGAPLCRGELTGTTLPSRPGEYIWARDKEIIRCPWHGWEFDITNGRSIYDPFKCRVHAYDVTIEPDDGEEWPTAESYPVTVERGNVVVHI